MKRRASGRELDQYLRTLTPHAKTASCARRAGRLGSTPFDILYHTSKKSFNRCFYCGQVVSDLLRAYIAVHKFENLGCATLLVALAPQLLTSSAAAQESVRPSPPSLVVRPLGGVQVSGVQGGPFSPPAFQYRVSASSGTVRYAIIIPSWLTASSRFDTADTSGVVITLTVNATATQLPPGTYRPHVAFRNVTNGHGSTDRIATLIVQAPSNVSKDGGPLLDGSGGYLLDDRSERLRAQ
jgi:hypothetical protein